MICIGVKKLKVCDFARVGKIVVNRWMAYLMSSASYSLVITIDKALRVLDVFIPSEYSFKRDEDFEELLSLPRERDKKIEDYNILSSFLIENKKELMKKWGLTAIEYVQLLIGLRFCLLNSCSSIPYLKKFFLYLGSFKSLKYLFSGDKEK